MDTGTLDSRAHFLEEVDTAKAEKATQEGSVTGLRWEMSLRFVKKKKQKREKKIKYLTIEGETPSTPERYMGLHGNLGYRYSDIKKARKK